MILTHRTMHRSERNGQRPEDLRKTRWWQQKTASGECYFCGKKVKFKDITMDHLLPLARGGRSTKDNIVPCCKPCNTKKKSMLPLEWEAYLDTISESNSK